MWESIQTWFLSLGEQYGVNPILFGTIYVAAIPFFTLSLAWLIRSIRQKKSVVVPALLTGFFFLSAYLYLIVVGHNVPFWVYGLIAAMVAFGVYSTIKKVKTKLAQDDA